MSVVIKDFDMPYCCELCNLSTYTDKKCDVLYCYATGHEIEQPTNKRDSNCPLIELPKQHGRLIDADDLLDSFMLAYPVGSTELNIAEELIECAETVIEAEDGE